MRWGSRSTRFMRARPAANRVAGAIIRSRLARLGDARRASVACIRLTSDRSALGSSARIIADRSRTRDAAVWGATRGGAPARTGSAPLGPAGHRAQHRDRAGRTARGSRATGHNPSRPAGPSSQTTRRRTRRHRAARPVAGPLPRPPDHAPANRRPSGSGSPGSSSRSLPAMCRNRCGWSAMPVPCHTARVTCSRKVATCFDLPDLPGNSQRLMPVRMRGRNRSR